MGQFFGGGARALFAIFGVVQGIAALLTVVAIFLYIKSGGSVPSILLSVVILYAAVAGVYRESQQPLAYGGTDADKFKGYEGLLPLNVVAVSWMFMPLFLTILTSSMPKPIAMCAKIITY